MQTLFALTLSGSLLALLLLLLKACLKDRFSSTVYYYAWLIVLLRFLLPLPGMLPLNMQAENNTQRQTVAAVYEVPEISGGTIRSDNTDSRVTERNPDRAEVPAAVQGRSGGGKARRAVVPHRLRR